MKVLKFGAVWCSGCLIMKPRWEEIEQANPELKTEYYDYDQDKEAIKKYKIDETLPTFIFLDSKNDELLRLTGEVEKSKLIEIINQYKNK